MAVSIYGTGSITGIPAGNVSGQCVSNASLNTTGGMQHMYDLSKKATLVTGITDSGTSIKRTYRLSDYVVMPIDTTAVILRVKYIHNGSTNHGYFYFTAYQNGFNSDCATYYGAHYDWYFNTTNEQIIVPWINNTDNNLKIQCTGSHNTDSRNTYDIYLDGIIRGTRKQA